MFFSPCDVYLDEHSNAVQPDIIFVASAQENIVKEDAIHGVPDLVIEIISPGNSKHDLVTKKELYQKFGVKEYWVIKPETKETTGFALKDGIYHDLGNHQGKVNSLLLRFEFDF